MTETQESPKDEQLHFGFIDFLFSLSVAQVAIKFSELISSAESTKTNIYDWANLPAYSHLALALLLITTSWIGWNKSHSSHKGTVFGSVWSFDFFELILDVLLVISYYVLVEHTDLLNQRSASANPELLCIACVFILYFIWDIVSKFPTRADSKGSLFGYKPWKQRLLPSIICTVIALGILFFRWRDPSSNPSTAYVLLTDASLAGLIISFRELKEHSNDYASCLVDWRAWLSLLILILPLLREVA
jgi:hypothetical protein